MSFFICPICSNPLRREERSYRCTSGHCFDIAKEGYVNLLPVNKKNSLLPGDNAVMSRLRHAFLSAGYYKRLLDEICKSVVGLSADRPRILDSGCGDGYYTAGLFSELTAAGKHPAVAGIDISKSMVRYAARREKNIEFAVSSAFGIPASDGSVDFLLNCFSPLSLDEFRRVLGPGGIFIYVVPAPDHLWELKEAVYERPYRNKEMQITYPGFQYEDVLPVDAVITLPDNETVRSLFYMTPYAWRTSKNDAAKLDGIDSLTTRISFRLHIFKRM